MRRSLVAGILTVLILATALTAEEGKERMASTA
jgi:hypothetical protein